MSQMMSIVRACIRAVKGKRVELSTRNSVHVYSMAVAWHALSSLQSSAVEQVLDILMDILSWEIAEVVSPCLPRGL